MLGVLRVQAVIENGGTPLAAVLLQPPVTLLAEVKLDLDQYQGLGSASGKRFGVRDQGFPGTGHFCRASGGPYVQ